MRHTAHDDRSRLRNKRSIALRAKQAPKEPFFNLAQSRAMRVSQPGDKTEIEADRSADRVTERLENSSPAPAPEVQEKISSSAREMEDEASLREEQPNFPDIEPARDSVTDEETASSETASRELEDEPVAASLQSGSANAAVADAEVDEPVAREVETEEPVASRIEEDELAAAGNVEERKNKVGIPAGEQEEAIQAKATSALHASAELQHRIRISKGKGQALPLALQGKLGAAFGGRDFSTIRIHTDTEATRLCTGLNAKAFAHGRDIYFNEGRYNPESQEGIHLLAHELTHTIQSGKAPLVSRLASDEQVSGSWMEELLQQLALSKREAREAEDPRPATESREQAKAEGERALVNARENQAAREARPAEPPAEKKAEPRVAEVKRRAPSKFEATTDAPPRGQVGEYLAEQSAQVCNQGAARAQRLADNESAHDSEGTKLEQTRSAVEPPEQENQSRKQAQQVDAVQSAGEPQTSPAANHAKLNTAIEESVPGSIEALNEFESKGKGKVVGNAVLGNVQKDVNAVKGTYREIERVPEAEPTAVPQVLPDTELAPETARLNLGKAAVPPLGEAHTDFSSFDKQSDDLMAQEQFSDEKLEMVDRGELAQAYQERQGLKKKVEESPKEAQQFAAEQTAGVEKDLQDEERVTRDAMKRKRREGLDATHEQQQKTKTNLELKREAVTEKVQRRFEAVKATVTKKLDDLETNALRTFDQQQKRFSIIFENDVRRRVDRWKDKRYSGLFAGVKWLKDKIVGIDHFPEVKAAFEDARNTYVKRIDNLIVDINAANARVIDECKQELLQAQNSVQAYIDGLEPELRKTGQAAMKEMRAKLKDLESVIDKRKEELQNKLCEKKDKAIEAIDQKIETMKSEMSGALGKLGQLLLNAALKFFKWALEKAGLKPQGLLDVVNKGVSVVKKIVTSPVEFFKNLAKAVGAGVGRFVTNIKKHLLNGMMGWLTGQMGGLGISLPEKFDLKGILSLVLQILGLTWAKIREKLVKRVGERAVAVAEKSVDIIKRLRSEGPIALWNMLKEKAAEIKETIIAKLRDWVIVQVVKNAVFKLATMLNPVGAIVQAIIAIYNLVMFFVDNIKRIVEFVKSIIDSVAKIAAGAIGAAAGFIENALARTVPIILSFMARFFGLSGIGKTVANIIRAIRKPVDKVVNKSLDFIAKMVRKVVGKVKAIAGKAKATVKGATRKAAGKLRKWWLKRTSFKAGGENHSLYFKTADPKSAIMVASEPRELGKFLKDTKPTGNEPELAQKYAAAVAQLANVERERNKLNEAIRRGDQSQLAANKKLLKEWALLQPRLITLMDALKGESKLEETKIDYKPLKHSHLGKGATAWPLTIKGKDGSEPSIENPIWNLVKERRAGSGNYYIRGHLINAKLHGPGSEPKNLTPISQKANRDHNTYIEEKVKDAVWNRGAGKDKDTQHVGVKYQVTAVYGNDNRPSLAEMKQKIKDTTQDKDRQAVLNKVVENEQSLPSRLETSAESIDKKKGKRVTTKIPLGNGGVVNNVIPNTVPELKGEPAKTLKRLSLSKPGSGGVDATKALSMVPRIDERLAKSIMKALATDSKRFLSWTDFEERVKGIGPKTAADLRKQPQVFLSGETKFE